MSTFKNIFRSLAEHMAVHRNSVEVCTRDCIVLVLSTAPGLDSVAATDFRLTSHICVSSGFALSRTQCHIF